MDSGDLNVVPEWLRTVWPEAPAECLHILMRTGGGSSTVALTHIENLNSASQCVLLTRLPCTQRGKLLPPAQSIVPVMVRPVIR